MEKVYILSKDPGNYSDWPIYDEFSNYAFAKQFAMEIVNTMSFQMVVFDWRIYDVFLKMVGI